MLIHRASLRKDTLRVDITCVENPHALKYERKILTKENNNIYKENNNEVLVCMQEKYIVFYSMVISI